MKPTFHHASLKSSRIQRVLRFLSARYKTGATTFEIGRHCQSTRPSSDLSECRALGIPIQTTYEGKSKTGRKIYRYKLARSNLTTAIAELPCPIGIGSGAVLGFVMDKMPWEVDWTIRIVIPGLDGNGAIWLETQFQRETRDEAEQMLDDIVAALKNLKREKRRDATKPNVRS